MVTYILTLEGRIFGGSKNQDLIKNQDHLKTHFTKQKMPSISYITNLKTLVAGQGKYNFTFKMM